MVDVTNIKYESTTRKLNALAILFSPAPKYNWEMIDKQGKKRMVFDQVNGIKLSDNNKLLTIEVVREDHAGTYVCNATTNVNGTTTTVQEHGKLRVRGTTHRIKNNIYI